jgi:hypothetical protein
VALGAGPDPEHRLRQERALDEDRRDAGQRERAHRAGLETGRVAHLLAACDACETGVRDAGDLVRVGPAVAGNQRDNRAAVAVEHERFHDLPELASDRTRRVLRRRRPLRELLDPNLGAGLAEVGGNALDSLRPLLGRHGRKGTGATICRASPF